MLLASKSCGSVRFFRFGTYGHCFFVFLSFRFTPFSKSLQTLLLPSLCGRVRAPVTAPANAAGGHQRWASSFNAKFLAGSFGPVGGKVRFRKLPTSHNRRRRCGKSRRHVRRWPSKPCAGLTRGVPARHWRGFSDTGRYTMALLKALLVRPPAGPYVVRFGTYQPLFGLFTFLPSVNSVVQVAKTSETGRGRGEGS